MQKAAECFWIWDPNTKRWWQGAGTPPPPLKPHVPGSGTKPAKPGGPYKWPLGYYQTLFPGGTFPVIGPGGKVVNVTVPPTLFWIYYMYQPGLTPSSSSGRVPLKPGSPNTGLAGLRMRRCQAAKGSISPVSIK